MNAKHPQLVTVPGYYCRGGHGGTVGRQRAAEQGLDEGQSGASRGVRKVRWTGGRPRGVLLGVVVRYYVREESTRLIDVCLLCLL